MTWAEFRDWAMIHHGYRIRWVVGTGAEWRAMWGIDEDGKAHRVGTGSGNPAVYGPVQQRRFAVWLRARSLVSRYHLEEWLTAAEGRDDGWLVNDGQGIRWVADPESEALDLLRRGFVAVECGL